MLSSIYKKRGPVLMMFGVVATIWLQATGQLGLYIHPRYFIFSVALAFVGLLAGVWSLGGYFHSDDGPTTRKGMITAALIILLSAASLLVVRPASLSSGIAVSRGINSGANTDDLAKFANLDVVSPFGNSGTLELNVKDWANLLSQTNDAAFFAGKQVKLTGFVVADTDDEVFFVSRFVLSCCAVDARPIGVPVYKPGWQDDYSPDQWIEVKGVFSNFEGRIVVEPASMRPIDQPKRSYVY